MKKRFMPKDSKQNNQLKYQASSKTDIIHRFSPKNYEMLSEEFLSFLELYKPSFYRNEMELVIEGCDCDEAEQKTIVNAIRNHFCMRLSEEKSNLYHNLIRLFWYLTCTILSGLLIYLVQQEKTELFVTFAYVPIWFFGYRLYTFLLMDIPELQKEIKYLERAASMKIVFCICSDASVGQGIYEAKNSEMASFLKKGIRNKDFIKHFYMVEDYIELECVTDDAEELIRNPKAPTEELLISEEFASYLNQAASFVAEQNNSKLRITCSSSNTKRLTAAVKNYYNLMILKSNQEKRENYTRILLYAAGVIASSILLMIIGYSLGIFNHEIIIILLWFFCDYLVEFALVNSLDITKERNKWISMRSLQIYFTE